MKLIFSDKYLNQSVKKVRPVCACGFLALITFLSTMSQDLSVSVRRVREVSSNAGWAEEHRAIRHMKLPRSEEASRGPRALRGGRGQSIGTQAHGFNRWYLTVLQQFQSPYSRTSV